MLYCALALILCCLLAIAQHAASWATVCTRFAHRHTWSQQRFDALGALSALKSTQERRRWEGCVPFDAALAVRLAGYAFEMYNAPKTGKKARGTDGTEIIFTSSDFIQQTFKGVVLVSVLSAQLDVLEENLLELALSGADPDAYVSVSIVEGCTRVLDSAQTIVQTRTQRPTWNQTFFLYVRNPEEAILNVTLYDKDIVTEDDAIGFVELRVIDLKTHPNTGAESYTIRNPQTQGKSADVSMSVVYIPWQANVSDAAAILRMQENLGKEDVIQMSPEVMPDVDVVPTSNTETTGPDKPSWIAESLRISDQKLAEVLESFADMVAAQLVGNSLDARGTEEHIEVDVSNSSDEDVVENELDSGLQRLFGGIKLPRVSQQVHANTSNESLLARSATNESSTLFQRLSTLAWSTWTRKEDAAQPANNNLESRTIEEPQNVQASNQLVSWLKIPGITQDAVANMSDNHGQMNDTQEQSLNIFQQLLAAARIGWTRSEDAGQFRSTPMQPTDDSRNSLNPILARMPKGATPSVDWRDLLTASRDDELPILGTKRLGVNFESICYIDNALTHTQAACWIDRRRKQIIVSFRGTESTMWKDLVTDLMILQGPYDEQFEVLRRCNVHRGFRDAFFSVRDAILQVLATVTSRPLAGSDGNEVLYRKGIAVSECSDEWELFITGHSLGGALATLLAFELCARQPLITSQPPLRITKYSFGAPRVGDETFARTYDAGHADSLRVVNNMDVVARLPRSLRGNPIMDYKHAGRTVMIDDEHLGVLWIEGETEGVCPLRDMNFLVLQNGSFPSASISDLNTWMQMTKDLQLDKSFVEAELRMLSAVFGGQALAHHFEDRYFLAMGEVLLSQLSVYE